MVLTFNIKSKGKSGVVEYYLNERVLEGTAYTLRGNPELTKTLIRSQNRVHKYKSGSLVFHKDDKVTDKIEEEIMDSFEDMVFIGIDKSQYNILWVKHEDKGRVELNFVIVREDLASGKDLDIHSHKRDLPLFNMWKNGINKKYGFVDPEAKNRKRTPQQRKKAQLKGKDWIDPETSFIAKRANIEEKLVSLAQDGKFQNRDEMVSFLENEGYKISRKNDKSFSIKRDDLGKKAKRLQDNIIFTSDFKNLADIQNAPEVKVVDKPIYFKRSLYLKYLETRRERHLKKYPAPVPVPEEEIEIEEKIENEFRNTETIGARDEEEERSRRRIDASAERARQRQDEILSCLEEYGADHREQSSGASAETYRERAVSYISEIQELDAKVTEALGIERQIEFLEQKIDGYARVLEQFGNKMGRAITGLRRGVQEGLYGLFETAQRWVDNAPVRKALERVKEMQEENKHLKPQLKSAKPRPG